LLGSVLYVEIDVFAALMLLIIMERGKSSLLTVTQRLFRHELEAVTAVLLLDAATWLLNGAGFPGARGLSVFFNYLYWASTLLPCYIGMLYCFCVVFGRLRRGTALAFAVPIFAGAALLALNPRSGWIFAVSAANVYARGRYFLAVGAIPFIHMAAAVAVTAYRLFRARPYERRKYVMLMVFMVLPLFGALAQILVYGVVTLWPGLALSMLMCYVYIQNGNLSTDPLTGLNNRGRFDTYTAWRWEALRGTSSLYLIVLDVDKFKTINDTCGHAEGDRALVRAAGVLKRAMDGRGGFLARIGGDEFAVVLGDADAQEAEALMARIRTLMEEENRAARRGYELSFSMGCAGVSGAEKTNFSEVFARADRAMYAEKKAARA